MTQTTVTTFRTIKSDPVSIGDSVESITFSVVLRHLNFSGLDQLLEIALNLSNGTPG
jgi:hypothetical protein